MEQDIALLNEGQARLEERQTHLQQEVATMHGSLCRLEGTGYEGQVATCTHRFLYREKDISTTVFFTQQNKQWRMHLLDHAERDGRITAIQLDEIERTDLNLNLTSQGPMDHVLAEVSITIQQHDIDSSATRAGLLTKATNGIVAPFVIGASCEPDFRWGGVKSLRLLEHPTPPTS